MLDVRSSWPGSGCWFEPSVATPVTILLCMIALLFTTAPAFSGHFKKKSPIVWKGKPMGLISSILAVASLREVVPPQTRMRGS